jgi:hypothetical protein
MSRPKIQKMKKPLGVSAVLALAVGGVAFALLQSQAKLTGNSISTESANLVISQNDITYTNAAAGYQFAHIIPGSQPSQAEHFFLRNIGSAPLALKVNAVAPPDNPNHVDLGKVKVMLSPYDMVTHQAAAVPQSFTLQSLVDAGTNGGATIDYPALGPNAIEEFDIKVAMDADALSGSAAAQLSNLDLGFMGVATAGTN